MKLPKNIALFCGLLSFFSGNSQQVYIIPEQTIKLYSILGFNDEWNIKKDGANFEMRINSLEITGLVTFGEYKEYLKAVKKDSSQSFYVTQFPDSGIASLSNYTEYISNKKYDAFPVLGISWEAAMNYCKWKTLLGNDCNDLKFIYRLPKLSEWLDAYNYLKTTKKKNDFNKNYSDWTMNFYVEGFSGWDRDTIFVYEMGLLMPRKNDLPRDKRMIAMGDSYLFQRKEPIQHFRTYFTFNGYRQIAFRLVKEPINRNTDPKSLSNRIKVYWGISKEK